MADRAVAPVVGKALEVGVVLVYLSLVTATLFGQVVPDARTAAGDEVADRALAGAAATVAEAVPAAGDRVRATARLDLPSRIRGRHYAIRAADRRLVLDHPHDDVAAVHRLALPERVVRVQGRVASDRPAVVRVRSTAAGLVVEVTTP